MIMHSIPKDQIIPDPNAKSDSRAVSTSSGQKRVANEISTDESPPEEGQAHQSKKSKVAKKCNSTAIL
jgi:hypothetical protein